MGICVPNRSALARTSVLAVLALASACASTPRSYYQEQYPDAPQAPEKKPHDTGPNVTEEHPRILASGSPLQCVPYARQQSGVEIFGNANRWWRLAAGKYHRSKVPAPGTVMVFNGSHEDPRGHVAVVRLVKDSRTLIVDHATWHGHGAITISNPVTDISPNNDRSQVKVLWIPGDQWGARTFSIAGFIYPEHEVASAGGVTGSVGKRPSPRRRVTADSQSLAVKGGNDRD